MAAAPSPDMSKKSKQKAKAAAKGQRPPVKESPSAEPSEDDVASDEGVMDAPTAQPTSEPVMDAPVPPRPPSYRRYPCAPLRCVVSIRPYNALAVRLAAVCQRAPVAALRTVSTFASPPRALSLPGTTAAHRPAGVLAHPLLCMLPRHGPAVLWDPPALSRPASLTRVPGGLPRRTPRRRLTSSARRHRRRRRRRRWVTTRRRKRRR